MAILPTHEEINMAFDKASKAVQEYIGSVELMRAFIEVREHYKLHLDEAGNISRALNAVFLGLRPAAEFPELLKAALEQNSSTYNAVLRDINEKIFVAFRRKMQEGGAPAQTESAPEKPQSPIERLERRVMGSETKAAPPEERAVPSSRPEASALQKNNGFKTDPYKEPIE